MRQPVYGDGVLEIVRVENAYRLAQRRSWYEVTAKTAHHSQTWEMSPERVARMVLALQCDVEQPIGMPAPFVKPETD